MDKEIEFLAKQLNAVVLFGEIENPGQVVYPQYLQGQAVLIINEKLDEKTQTMVILHELGHVALDRSNRCLYDRTKAMKLKMECRADTYMIEKIIDRTLKGIDIIPESFNYLDFMEQVGIPSKDEIIVKEAMKKYLSKNQVG
ncbi:ImmA/IrrE family metallo-endopeptidase [Ligilactobacillus saerimneri]|uniref:ImmA/IrrE family metallo-endopeptidase n=1 Tax=Ligilactobacillus saerimneri TaxID=228229 RepID=UPI0024B89EC2|nr:ImmA/IrrE family metallo-endopeptidase [Ligilactobacillus saerimneri]